MHDLSRLLSILQDRGSRGLCLERVHRLLYNPELHLASYGKIYRNFGAMTRGATSETADGKLEPQDAGAVPPMLSGHQTHATAFG